MRRFMAAVAAVLFLSLVLAAAALGFSPGCTLLNPATGEDQVGLPTAVTAEVLRGLADDVELWDINKDGLNTDQELFALGLAATQRLIVAWRQHNAEAAIGEAVDR